MNAMRWSLFLLVAAACSASPRAATGDVNAGVDSLNARLAKSFRDRDPKAYATTFTDSGSFEWPAFNTVRGRAALEAMVRGGWATLKDMDLRLSVSSRHVAPDHVTEFGAFEQSFSDSSGARQVEYGRYVALLRQGDGGWLIDRFFGFADSTRPAPAQRP
jgi:ketosteroid isomerase-like protein